MDPTRDIHDDPRFQAMSLRIEARLNRAHDDGPLRLTVEELEYFGQRFTERHVRFWTGVAFQDYLHYPQYWERVLRQKRRAFSRATSVRVCVLRAIDPPSTIKVHFN